MIVREKQEDRQRSRVRVPLIKAQEGIHEIKTIAAIQETNYRDDETTDPDYHQNLMVSSVAHNNICYLSIEFCHIS